MDEVIDTADHVKHGPTGETWVVGYVRGDKLAACGWPDTLANLSDCTLVKKATDAERLSLLQEMARSSGHRASYARERLATSGVALPCAPRRWIERWHGSGPDRGWWVWEADHGDSIAYCGEGEFAERLCSLVVQKHNAASGVDLPDGAQR